MNRIEAYKLAIREIRKIRKLARYNAMYMADEGYKQKLEEEAKEYAEAEGILTEEMKRDGK